ncbi:MAG: hypothetical protein ACXVB1_00040 [Pseudobdellovibrionaceae bacterium]
MVIFRSENFTTWFNKQPAKIQAQIESRISRIVEENYFGTINKVGEYCYELKFNNGNRIYYTIKNDMFLILGGNKNGQQKDINKANKVAEKIHSEET